MAANLVMPNPDKRQHDWHICGTFGSLEMRVHFFSAEQKLSEIIRANCQHQTQPDWSPDGIPPTDPILESKNAAAINPEGRRLFKIGGQSGKVMPRDLCPDPVRDPVFRSLRIRHRLNSGKRLGCDDDQRLCRIEAVQRIRDMCAIHI